MANVTFKLIILTILALAFTCPVGISAEETTYTLDHSVELQQKLQAAYLVKGREYKPRTEHLNADGSPNYINRLILEDSPYLLQHAHNPVDWRPWGDEAFAAARAENKPIFLSIGYSTCHWCHVMERESFEDPAIARYLNDHFIPIKVDRESHPDVDEVYMTAVILINRQGGWPMSSFLTPDGKPFFGGTYYPPKQFRQLLGQVQALWQEHPEELKQQAQRIAQAVDEANSHQGEARKLDQTVSKVALNQLSGMFDEIQGGFGQAPKFPQEPWLLLLLDQAERASDKHALQMLEVTLDHMARGGIYDQVAGGFHRYSTDYEWLAPHFEKMLYNQAQLARVYLGAWRLTGKTQYRRIVTQTLDYVLREMTHPEGGFYSATDADSEGEEGLFFTWTPDEIRQALTPEEAELATRLYDVTSAGNFEGRNILHLREPLEEFAAREKLDPEDFCRRIDTINGKLRAAREKRVHPLRDDKIITSWNGMLIGSFAQAAGLLRHEGYRKAAERAAAFIWRHNHPAEGRLWRIHLSGQSSIPGNLEDYAYLAEAFLYLYDLTGQNLWLQRSRELAKTLLAEFTDPSGAMYLNLQESNRFTDMGRPRDGASDGAIPSGSSVALHVLQILWGRTGDAAYKQAAESLLAYLSSSIAEHPASYGYLLTALNNLQHGELGAMQYAANGQVKVHGRLTSTEKDGLELTVDLEMPPGWHINAHETTLPEMIPTELQLGADVSEWQLSEVSYPAASMQQLEFSPQPLPVYQDKVRITGKLVSPEGVNHKAPLPILVRLQACSNQVCLPPEQITLRLIRENKPL